MEADGLRNGWGRGRSPDCKTPLQDLTPDPYPHFIGLTRWPGRVRSPRRGWRGRTSPSRSSASRAPPPPSRGQAIGLAGEEAAEAGDAAQEVPVGGEACCRLLKLGGEDVDRRLRHGGRGGAVLPGGIAQAQETNGDDGQRPEQRHQAI